MIKNTLFFSLIGAFTIVIYILLPVTYEDLSFISPSFYLTCLPSFYYLFKNKKDFFIFCALFSLIIDFLFSEVFLLIFSCLMIACLITYYFLKRFSFSFINSLVLVMFLIVFYDTTLFFIILLTKKAPFLFTHLIYKLFHSLLYPFIVTIFSYMYLKSRNITNKRGFNYR